MDPPPPRPVLKSNLPLTYATPMTPPNPFSLPEPWTKVATGYAETTMHFLAGYAQIALKLAHLSKDAVILDVACGPGTLSRLAAPHVRQVDAVDFSPEMITLFEAYIRGAGWANVQAKVADGQALPFPDNTFDAVFSMFGLMFFPNRVQGFKELYRTLKPGGIAIVSSWAPADQSPLMRLMFQSMRAANPAIPQADTQILNLEKRDVFQTEMEAAGFQNIRIEKHIHGMEVTSVDAFWEAMVKGSAPIVMMREKYTPEDWSEFESKAKAYLSTQLSEFPVWLTSDAWIGRGVKAASPA